MSKSPPKNKFMRSAKLLSAAGKFAIGEVGRRYKTEYSSKVNEALMARAIKLVQSLDHLKGFPLKVGQLLSLDTTGILPDEIRQVFIKLQSNATPVDHQLMKTVFNQQLGELAKELTVDWTSIASASLGQVYLAHDQAGNKLALKIQYPGIESSLDGDMFIIKKLTPLLTALSGKKIDLDGVFSELHEMFEKEVDYRNEARMIERFSSLIQTNQLWRSPKLFERYCSDHIIAMEFLEGESIQTWIHSHPEQSSRDEIAKICIDLFCCELFEWNLVQTDPNFANFLICQDGKLGLLDFGATQEFELDFVEKYRSLLIALRKSSPEEVIRLSEEFNLIDPREDQQTKESYLKMVEVSVRPFVQKGEFYFRDDEYLEATKKSSWEFIKNAKYSPPPRHLLFLHRKLGGLYNLLHQMDIKLDLDPFWNRWIERD
tara:strand:- start:7207 stop:8496 length:1290 start_codon:yes stop_codon:yes gene_type:complete